MKKTFLCDDSMIITIPIGSLKDAREGQLMPEKFHCVFKDSYKVFAMRGKPKPLGAAQAIAGVFIVALGVMDYWTLFYALPSILFVLSGILSFAAGKFPNMHVTKLSFSLNIICIFWSVAAVCIFANTFYGPGGKVGRGIKGLIVSLLVIEMIMALFLIYWLSKAICRQHFNTLPIILLKQGD